MSFRIAKIWMVPLSDEQAIYFETGSKEMQKTSAVSVPLLSSYKRVVVSVSKILTRVPLSDAVASKFPSEFSVIAATGL